MEITFKHKLSVFLIAALCVVLIVFSIIGLRRMTSRARNYDSTAEGLTYLRQLASRDLAEVDETLAAQKRARESAEREERIRELTDGTVDVWSYFTDYVFFGDSRAVGFEYFGFLSENRVIAESGWTIRDLQDNLGSIIAMNPTSVFLAFGLNDLGMGFWDTADEYAAEFRTVLDSIAEQLPNASIYVNSILPVTEAAAAEPDKGAWQNIPEYNAAVKKMCRESGRYTFIDNDAIVAEHSDMFDQDGVHMVRDFYPYWAANMMLTIYGNTAPAPAADSETGEETDTEITEDGYTETDDGMYADAGEEIYADTGDGTYEETYVDYGEETYADTGDGTYTEEYYDDTYYAEDTGYEEASYGEETWTEAVY